MVCWVCYHICLICKTQWSEDTVFVVHNRFQFHLLDCTMTCPYAFNVCWCSFDWVFLCRWCLLHKHCSTVPYHWENSDWHSWHGKNTNQSCWCRVMYLHVLRWYIIHIFAVAQTVMAGWRELWIFLSLSWKMIQSCLDKPHDFFFPHLY